MKRIIAALLALGLLAGAAGAAGLTVTKSDEHVPGSMRFATCRVKFDDSYLTGGEALTAAQIGLTSVIYAWAVPDTVTSAGYGFHYDITNSLLIAFAPTVSTDPASFNIVSDGGAADTIAVNVPATSGTFTRAAATGNLQYVIARVFAFGY